MRNLGRNFLVVAVAAAVLTVVGFVAVAVEIVDDVAFVGIVVDYLAAGDTVADRGYRSQLVLVGVGQREESIALGRI